MRAAKSSCSAAAIIGPRCPKSGESIVTSAAITIWFCVPTLGVVALHPAARRLDIPGVRVSEIDLARRCSRAAGADPADGQRGDRLHPPAGAIGLISRVRLALDPVLLLQAPLGVLQAFGTRAGDRARRSASRRLAAQPAAPALRSREL